MNWIAGRLVMGRTAGVSPPHWPPTERCLALLKEGRIGEALTVADDPAARFHVTGYLRPEVLHVLLAHDLLLDRRVVIKLILAPDRFARVIAAREARLLARLSHPNVLNIYEVDPGGMYLVLEHLDGDLRDHQSLGPELVLDALCQAGRGLAAVHRSGLRHGDFRLENVLVQAERDDAGKVVALRAKLGDFGEARASRADSESVDELADLPAGQLPRGAHEDQHAFAVAVWEVLTAGQLPPAGGELIDPHLRAVLVRALMDEASQRWADMTALVDAIERGRVGAAADSRSVANRSPLLDQAVAKVEAGKVAAAMALWKSAEVELDGHHAVLGEGGFRLGAALAKTTGTGTSDGAGLALAIKVLLTTTRHLHAARRPVEAELARDLAAVVCDLLVARGHPKFERLGAQLRELSQIYAQQETKEE